MRGLGGLQGAGVPLLLPGADPAGPGRVRFWGTGSHRPGGGAGTGWLATAGFLICYLAGCALAVLAVVRTRLIQLLSEKE